MSTGLAWELDDPDDGTTLAAALRRHHPDALSWGAARKAITTGKVFVDGARLTDPAARVEAEGVLVWQPSAPRAGRPAPIEPDRLAFVDGDVVVVRKPAGIATVPFEDREPIVLLDRVSEALRRAEHQSRSRVLVCHRLDKGTSGLLVFARNVRAQAFLKAQFRAHSVERRYVAFVHGTPRPGRYESRLVPDRGDGYRGSTQRPDQGKASVTHVTVAERYGVATKVTCKLETGRTHQIRIHLSEEGHPLVGDAVYHTAAARRGRFTLPVPPELAFELAALHAATLGFDHPRTSARLRFEEPMPADMVELEGRLASLVRG